MHLRRSSFRRLRSRRAPVLAKNAAGRRNAILLYRKPLTIHLTVFKLQTFAVEGVGAGTKKGCGPAKRHSSCIVSGLRYLFGHAHFVKLPSGYELATARRLVLPSHSLLPFSLSTQELGKRREVEQAATRIADLVLQGLVAH